MSYDDVEVEDMEWNEELGAFTYPCPCGDLFQITKVRCLLCNGRLYGIPHLAYINLFAGENLPADLRMGEEIARCPSCSLFIKVIYNQEDFQEKKTNPKNTPEKISTGKGGTVIVVA